MFWAVRRLWLQVCGPELALMLVVVPAGAGPISISATEIQIANPEAMAAGNPMTYRRQRSTLSRLRRINFCASDLVTLTTLEKAEHFSHL